MIEQIQQSSLNTSPLTTSSPKTDSGQLEIEGIMHGVTVERAFKAGDQIPITFEMNTDLMQLKETTAQTIEVSQDFFVRLGHDELLFSLDGEHWSYFTEAFSGNFGVSANITDENQRIPELHALLVAHLRG